MAEEEKKAPEGEAAPAGEAPAEGAEGEAAPAKKKLPILIIAIAAGVVLLVVGVVIFFVFTKSGEKEEVEPVLGADVGVFLEMPPTTLNMMADQGGEHYLKAKLTLEVPDEAAKVTVEAMMPRLQDDLTSFLRTLRPEDVQGSAAVQKLKEALLLRANQVLAPVVVRQVLLTEFLVQ